MVDINFTSENQSDYNLISYRNTDVIYDRINGCLYVTSSDNTITPGILLGKPFTINANENYKISVDAESISGNPIIYIGYWQNITNRKYITTRNVYTYILNMPYTCDLTPGILLSRNKKGDSFIVYSFSIKKVSDELYLKLAEPDIIISTQQFAASVTFNAEIITPQITSNNEDIIITTINKEKNIILDNNVILNADLSIHDGGIIIAGNSINNCINISSNTQIISVNDNSIKNIAQLSFQDVSLIEQNNGTLYISKNDNLTYGQIYDTYYNKPRLEVYCIPINCNKFFIPTNIKLGINIIGNLLTFNYHSYKFNKFILSITKMDLKINVNYVGQSTDWIKIYFWLSTDNIEETTNKIWCSINPVLGIASFNINYLFDMLCFTKEDASIVILKYSVENIADHIISLSSIILSGLLEATIPFIPTITII